MHTVVISDDKSIDLAWVEALEWCRDHLPDLVSRAGRRFPDELRPQV